MVGITIVIKSKPICPYCNERPVKIKTCGHFVCQFKHHIFQMRKRRKTDQKRYTRRIEV